MVLVRRSDPALLMVTCVTSYISIFKNSFRALETLGRSECELRVAAFGTYPCKWLLEAGASVNSEFPVRVAAFGEPRCK